MRSLARDLQGIGQAIAEIISSSTTTYAHKRIELDYWMTRQAAANNDLMSAKAALDAAIDARQSA